MRDTTTIALLQQYNKSQNMSSKSDRATADEVDQIVEGLRLAHLGIFAPCHPLVEQQTANRDQGSILEVGRAVPVGDLPTLCATKEAQHQVNGGKATNSKTIFDHSYLPVKAGRVA